MGLESQRTGLIAFGRSVRYALAITIICTCFSATVSRGVLITFSDLDGFTHPSPMLRGGVNGATYGSAQGMPDGISGTFTGFDEYSNTDPNPLNHDHTGNTNWRAIYGISDPDDTGVPAYLNFTAPVQVSSLWFDNWYNNWPASEGTPAYGLEVVGSLDGSTVWSYSYTFTAADIEGDDIANDVFLQITSGANLAVDQLEFINVEDVAIDDITINSVPEPSCLGLLIFTSAGLMFQRKFRSSVK